MIRGALDMRLVGLQEKVGPRPELGWVRTLRFALGMSTSEMATRMHLTQSRVSQIERAEVDGSILMSTLIRAAKALNCEVVYVLVPSESLEDMVMRQAFLRAGQELGYDASNEVDDVDDDDDDQDVKAAVRLEHQEFLAVGWVDRRGLWTSGGQPAARAGPVPPDPSPTSWGGAP
jgi:predicted DNA-binding mobile mystery protein A